MRVAKIEAWYSTMGICISDLQGEYITTVIKEEEPQLYERLAKAIDESEPIKEVQPHGNC